jgi:hypothetical protein
MTAIRLASLLAVSLPFLAVAQDPQPSAAQARFADIKAKAEPQLSLGEFVERFFGTCPADKSKAAKDCEKKVEATRATFIGKPYFSAFEDSLSGIFRVQSVDVTSGEFEALLTPFFAAGDSAITQGAPKSIDRDGNPMFNMIVLHGTMPEAWTASSLRRAIESGGIRIEVVFTPLGVWKAQRKGGPEIHGIKSRIDGVSITIRRTGEHLATWLP